MDETRSYLKEILGLSVQTNMRAAPPTVSPVDTISTVMDLMIKENVGSVVIVDNSQPVGIITEKDVLQKVIRLARSLELTLAGDVMSKPLVTIDADRTIADALEALQRHAIRRLIISKDGALVGLTTERRLLDVAQGNYMVKGRGTEMADGHELHKVRIVYVSTYPPRECGIAAYTVHLVDATSTFCSRAVAPPVVIAINDKGGLYDYEVRVKFQIESNEIQSYEKAAQYINASDVDVVNLQHEYGIYGGEWGEHAIEFLKRIEKPVVTTLHTVLERPAPDARRVLGEIIENSDFAIVLAKAGIGILEQLYGGSRGEDSIHTTRMSERASHWNCNDQTNLGVERSGSAVDFRALE